MEGKSFGSFAGKASDLKSVSTSVESEEVENSSDLSSNTISDSGHLIKGKSKPRKAKSLGKSWMRAEILYVVIALHNAFGLAISLTPLFGYDQPLAQVSLIYIILNTLATGVGFLAQYLASKSKISHARGNKTHIERVMAHKTPHAASPWINGALAAMSLLFFIVFMVRFGWTGRHTTIPSYMSDNVYNCFNLPMIVLFFTALIFDITNVVDSTYESTHKIHVYNE